ncbi:carboxymuconolactone decarboxylase family protein [Rhodococcus sp. SJ-3]|uniref:carboxymuconolactone decarboxylase family protein n=1 Tax=Rhodococcus sp. SJ-3 TaxID=3454628 RepID=UPI003F7AE3C7
MDQHTYDTGQAIRTMVLGQSHVTTANANAFSKPMQDLATEYCWGAVWGREVLTNATRSMLNLAMLSILDRPRELRTHLKGALNNGVSRDEICEVFLQVAVYAGVPAGMNAFRVAEETFAELDAAAER